jgi:membrane fusion protein (multidrug efflux system)
MDTAAIAQATVTEGRVTELNRDLGPGNVDPSALAAAGHKPRWRPTRKLVVSALAVAVALGGVLWITATPSSESTDDAYVAAEMTTVAPKVRGLVAEVFVRENQAVRAGQPLVRIDAEEFEARLQSARADLADADAALAGARAALVSHHAEEQLAAANVVATRTAIRSTAAEASRADADRRRYDALIADGAVSRRDVDTYRATAVGAEQGAARARAQLVVAQRQASVAIAQRPTLQAAIQQAEAARLRAAAVLDLARQDQRHTLIRAAIDGTVGDKQAHVGDYVQAGSRLLTLVPLHALYVTANFKETQVRDMKVGQPVTIEIDALHGQDIKGHVESFAPGSGSTFALLPFEPGTGNFTKIVQRIPVRIRFDPGQQALSRLRPGLSVTAKVHISR